MINRFIFLFVILEVFMLSHTQAQELKSEINSPVINLKQDSAVISFQVSISASQIPDNGHITLIPVYSGLSDLINLPNIVVNSKKAQKLYMRKQALRKRKDNNSSPGKNDIVVLADEEVQNYSYRVSLPLQGWMKQGKLVVKRETYTAGDEKMSSEVIELDPEIKSAERMPISRYAPIVKQGNLEQKDSELWTTNIAESPRFKGSYLEPEPDATDERNQRELNFTPEEARVIANINPQILSLRELYLVAVSYKNSPELFYKFIDLCVNMYPTSPVANLNAASAAIERNDVEAAGKYLQIASHETLAYKNCKGVYELLCNNIYEGIRLLKAAVNEGCEEANYNLKIFFEVNNKQ